jgi:hypothetical protein
VNAITPLRVSEEEEQIGIDIAYHGEFGYQFLHPELNLVSGSRTDPKIVPDLAMMTEQKASGGD